MEHALVKLFVTLVFVWIIADPAKSSNVKRGSELYDYVEKLADDLGNSQDENVLFVFDQDFLRRNTNAADKTRLTAIFDTSSITNSFRVHLAFVKFHNNETVTDLSMEEENGVSLALNAQDLPVKNTSTTDLYDISSLLDEWRIEGDIPGKLSFVFSISNSKRKESRKRVLEKWNSITKDSAWLQIGPVFLVAYSKDTATSSRHVARPNPSSNEARAHKLRSGAPSTCKRHSFQTSFAQLNLAHVYVKPSGLFNMFVCYGPCDATGSVDSRVSFMTIHAWMLELARRVLSNPPVARRHLESTCVATGHQGLWVTKREANGNLKRLLLRDFTASACGCR